MTREEITTAIETLSYMKEQNPQLKSLDVAIEALNRQLKEMDALDKIRAEIIDESYLSYDGNPRRIIDESWVIAIIDKYKTESEDKK